MDSPRLTFPAQQQGQHLLVETDPAELKSWLKSLPYGDMGRAVPEISRAIASLNRSEIGVSQRKELVSLFDTAYAQIFDAYRPYAAHITNVETRRREYNNLHLLTREMAFAHKIITDAELNKRKLWGKNKGLIKGINLSLHYLGLQLMEHYESYSPIPAYLWRECNGLYAYAQMKQLEDTSLSSENQFQCLNTIEKTFARICLMSLADPYHLSYGEHWQLFKYLERWSHLAEFSDDHGDFKEETCFIVQLNSQIKPSYSSQFEGDLDDQNVCMLLTHDVIRQLQYQNDALIQTGESPQGFYNNLRPGTAQALLEHMAAHWNSKIERKGRRYPVITKLDVIWGMHAIHTLLQKHRKSPDSTHWDSETIESYIGHEHKVQLNWDASNVSDGGIGITTHNNIADQLKVGELVIIREYIDKKPSYRWRPAVCRWLFGDDNQGTRAGLEFIDGNFEPCRINTKLAKNAQTSGQAALLFKPAASRQDDPLALVCNRGTFKDGREFLLRHKNQLEDIRARKRTLVTPCIEMFHFQSFEVIEVNDPEPEEPSDMIPWTSMPNHSSDSNDGEQSNETINLDSVRLPGDH
ncbi:hypothetical protein [Pleionea litopenaei]|uniref:PilZ domain-containing protein n=1 Tax=Pleionea litopenaei TaxID=3070815 RepID=A0AA51RTQ8_9GAMM|nr:hypothetical protein [Pleionea sp. HL-JVS1]WMS87422.1 hypothetical protein Q9312_00490 [Pleionea sp. HL-JVS1]